MIVVLDTTEIFSDPRLEGPNFSLLQVYLQRTSSTLAVPQVVFEEAVNHFREHIEKHVRCARNDLADIKRLLKSEQNVPDLVIDEAQAVTRYKEHLEAQITTLGGRVMSYECVELAALVERALRRRKPFDEKGKVGFRDAVLWETVLFEVLQKNDYSVRVALITKNSNDFGKKEVFAGDLREDCTKIGKSTECVRLFDGLQSFIDAEVKPHLRKLEDIRSELGHGKYRSFVLSEFFDRAYGDIERECGERVSLCEIGRLMPYLSGNFHSPYLQSMDRTPEEYAVKDVWSVDDTRLAVGLHAVFRADVFCLEAQWGHVQDGNQLLRERWDDGFQIGGLLRVAMTALLDKESGETQLFNVDDVEIDLNKDVAFPP